MNAPAYFWPVAAKIITPVPRVLIRKRAKRGAPAPEITPGMEQAQIVKIRNLQAMRLKRAATRVNRQDFSISPTPQADSDRSRQIQGSGNRYRTA